jgi:capsular polysaccharide transport system permease protein
LQPAEVREISTTSPEEKAGRLTLTSEAESALDQRRRLRAEARRERRRRRLFVLGLVLAPVVIAGLYIPFFAVPRFAAEARFTVRANTSQSSSGSPTTNVLSTGGGGGLGGLGGFVDGWAVQDFLNSRDCMRELDRHVGLRKYLSHGGLDPLNHLSPNASDDDLYKAYQNQIHNSYDLISQINGLRVSAFSPSDAALLSNALLKVSSDFVNKMDQKGVEDALKVSRLNLTAAEQKDRDTLAAIAQWRIEHGNIDPTADATMLLNQVGQIETDLTTAQVNLEKIRAMGNPDHPMLGPAEQQVEALRRRMGEMRGQMSGAGNTEARQLKTYVQLMNAQTFADANLLSARQTYQQAFTDAGKLERYLSVIARPVPEGTPSSPDIPLLLMEALAAGFVLAALVTAGGAVYRSFRHA